MRKATIIILLGFLFTNCNNMSENSYAGDLAPFIPDEALEYEEEIMTAPQNKSMKILDSVKKNEKIIRTGNIRIESKELKEAKSAIDQIVKKYDGYYENEVLKNYDYRQKYSLRLRVPSEKFALLVNEVENVEGEILEKHIEARDVGEEYLDLEIRLDNNKAYLTRYQNMLNKAVSIKDMVEIQEKIRQIELLIDSNKGRLMYLNDQTSYSTLNIQLSSKPIEQIAAAPPSYFDELKGSFGNGLYGVRSFSLFIVNFWPILLLVIVIITTLKILKPFQKKKGFISEG